MYPQARTKPGTHHTSPICSPYCGADCSCCPTNFEPRLMFEIADETKRRRILAQLGGIEETITIRFGISVCASASVLVSASDPRRHELLCVEGESLLAAGHPVLVALLAVLKVQGQLGMPASVERRRGVHCSVPVSAMWFSRRHTYWQIRSARSVSRSGSPGPAPTR